MYIVKSSDFIAYSIISMIIASSFFTIYQINPNQMSRESDNLFSQPVKSNSDQFTYLFSFDPLEKEYILKTLKMFNPFQIYFYKNFPVGFVTLKENQVSKIQNSYPKLFSKLYQSEKVQVIPSMENLDPNSISKITQSQYHSPASIIKATDLWEEGVDGSGVKIAIIDTGIDANHEDFTDRVSFQKSFVNTTFGFGSSEGYNDLNGHGTHVAGIAAGSGDLYPGIAYNAYLYNLKVADMSGYSTKTAIIAAMDEAITQQVDVISLSLGFETALPWSSDDELNMIVDYAVEQGILVVCSAGNGGENNLLSTITSPASASKVLSVGATNNSDKVASFSSRGPSINYRIDPDILAPGTQIVGPLAGESAIKKAYNSIEDFSLTDYVVLSGTSMAAPVVSGAIALLKQKYPTASPSALRAAIQETALDLGVSLFQQGSGLIDVSSASDLLESVRKNDDFELISSLPKDADVLEFSNILTFPGDSSKLTLSFMTGTGGIVEWQISNSIIDFITFDIDSQFLAHGEYFEKDTEISIPIGTASGIYQGSINYTFIGVSHEILIQFEIKNPKSKIYWDTHYTGKDDSPFFNFRALEEHIANELSLDINQYDDSISWQNLSQNDILVLADLEYPLTSEEIELISKFHQQNGSILLITSAFPYYNLNPYEQIANILNIPVNFSDRIDLIDYIDNGRSRDILSVYSDFDVNWRPNDPLFNDVDTLPLFMGTAFDVNVSNPYLSNFAEIQPSSYYAIAGYKPPQKGKVLILGCELWLYSFFLSIADGKNFARNVFEWLRPENKLAVNSEISVSYSALETYVFADSQSSLSMDISFSNGSEITGIPLIYNTTLDRYHSMVSVETQEHLKMSIAINNASMTLKKYDVFHIPKIEIPKLLDVQVSTIASSDIIFPSWYEDDSGFYVVNERLDFFINNTELNTICTVLVISSQLEETLSVIIPPIDTLEDYIYEAMILNGSNINKTYMWNIPSNISTGFYSYEIYTWLTFDDFENFTISFNTKRGLFYIPDPEPSLNASTTINGHSVEYYRDIEYLSDIPYWGPNEEIELNIIGQDNNSNEFIVYIQFIHYYFWLADRLVLGYSEIPASTTFENENNAIFTVPDESIPIPGQEDYKIEIDNQIFFLLIFIRDQQGNSYIEPIFFRIGHEFDIDPLFLIFGVFAAIGAIGLVVFLVRRSRPRKTEYYSPQYKYSGDGSLHTENKFPYKMIYCPHCGKQIPSEARYCSYCGNHIDIEIP